MLKTLTILFRGEAARAAEKLADDHALLILDQQVRDAGTALDRGRRALAIAMAQDANEQKRIADIIAKITDLESRAMAALEGDREDLAEQAAEAIAGLEADKASAQAAHASFLRESGKLRALVVNAERRLAEIERGRRAARASEAILRLRSNGVVNIGGDASALRDAEATLKRLRERQMEAEFADLALEELDGTSASDLVAEKLEAAGFGPQNRPTAKSVMDRLKQNRAAGRPAA